MIEISFIERLIERANTFIWGWPLILFFLLVGLIATCMLRGIQMTHFFHAWKLLFASADIKKKEDAEISPLQAFINILSTSIGNGSLAGMATAIYSGGPGAAFWVLVIGFFGLIIRFCEVYLSDIQTQKIHGILLGGPMIYLRRVPGGKWIPYVYTFFCLLLAFTMGNAMQTNSISVGIIAMTGMSPYIIASGVLIFMAYLIFGGAERILRASDIIVPFKVGLFFISAFYVLIYHYKEIIPALHSIVVGAFNPQALTGGIIGYTVLSAIRFGMSRSLNATETGLGTASILFGSTGQQKPVESGLIAMISAFVSNYLVCFLLMLIIIASGVWNNGQTSTALTISAFQTAFGQLGGWVVILLSIFFGMGVLVSYAFIGREAWKFLTNGRYLTIYSAIYCVMAVFGVLVKVDLIWSFSDLVVGGLTLINIFGIMWLLPEIRKGVLDYKKNNVA